MEAFVVMVAALVFSLALLLINLKAGSAVMKFVSYWLLWVGLILSALSLITGAWKVFNE